MLPMLSAAKVPNLSLYVTNKLPKPVALNINLKLKEQSTDLQLTMHPQILRSGRC